VGVGHGSAVKIQASRSAGIALLFVALTAVMTWPQVTRLSTQVYDSDDPLLSIWRISWIAHISITSTISSCKRRSSCRSRPDHPRRPDETGRIWGDDRNAPGSPGYRGNGSV